VRTLLSPQWLAVCAMSALVLAGIAPGAAAQTTPADPAGGSTAAPPQEGQTTPPPAPPAGLPDRTRPGDDALPPQPPLLAPGVYAAQSLQPGRAFERPYRARFAGSQIGPDQPGLSMTLNSYGAYDDNIRPTRESVTLSDQSQTYYGGGGVLLDYLRPGPRLSINASGSSDIRKYELFEDLSHSHAGRASILWSGRKTSLQVAQAVARTPLFRYSLFPGVEPDAAIGPAAFDIGLTEQNRLSTASDVLFTRTLTTRSSLTGSYGYSRAISDDDATLLVVHRGGAAYERSAGRFGTLRFGYGFQRGEQRVDDALLRDTRIDSLDIGGSYARPLSFSRRTTVGFTAGSAILSRGTAPTNNSSLFRVVGTGTVSHEMGRTWTLGGSYNRGVQFVEGFTEPFFVDTAHAGLTGLLSRRTQLDITSTFSNGRLGLTLAANDYRSVMQRTAVGFSLTQSLLLTTEYGYYWYDFGNAIGLPNELSSSMNRQMVMVSISYWMPLYTPRTRP
jgi:hypothetical protein